MLEYFIRQQDISKIDFVCKKLNHLKLRIQTNDYFDCRHEYEDCKLVFEEILAIAKKRNDEKLANACWVYRQYFLFFCAIARYFQSLEDRLYRDSWDQLQDCIDIAGNILKFTWKSEQYEIPMILQLLKKYESMYPFTVFASSEYVISKSHCSICGESMLNLNCPHIRGNLYWGQMAVEIIDKISELKSVSIVESPEDKRCVLMDANDQRSEDEKYALLKQFLDLKIAYLQDFLVSTTIEKRKRPDIKKVGRNDPCSCGSGLKFKKCCYSKILYEHQHITITKKEMINLIMM